MKMLKPVDVAEIINGLLLKPEMMNELKDPKDHQAFFKEITEFLAERFGGEVKWLNAPYDHELEKGYMVDFHSLPHIAIDPSENLRSKNDNIWMFHDQAGWEFSKTEIEVGEEKSRSEINKVREELRSACNEAMNLEEEIK